MNTEPTKAELIERFMGLWDKLNPERQADLLKQAAGMAEQNEHR